MAIDRDSLTLRHIRDVEDEVLKHFSCGRSQLDDFLLEDARDYDAHGLTSTVIVFAEGYSAPAAYFSLTADSVHLSSGERTDLGLPFDVPISFYPAVKITKLAVMSELQRSGIGDIKFKCQRPGMAGLKRLQRGGISGRNHHFDLLGGQPLCQRPANTRRGPNHPYHLWVRQIKTRVKCHYAPD